MHINKYIKIATTSVAEKFLNLKNSYYITICAGPCLILKRSSILLKISGFTNVRLRKDGGKCDLK